MWTELSRATQQKHLEGLLKQITRPHLRAWIQWACARARELAFLTSPQVTLMLLILRRHSKNHWAAPRELRGGFGSWRLHLRERGGKEETYCQKEKDKYHTISLKI